MWARSAKIYGVGKHKSRIPSTGVVMWLLLSMAMWATFAYSYFRGSNDLSTLIMAIFFTIGLAVTYFLSLRHI